MAPPRSLGNALRYAVGMSYRWIFAILAIAVASCQHASAPTATATVIDPTPKTVHVAMFGDVTIADGAIAVMDGGIEGVQGHTLVLFAADSPTWQRRLEGMQPSGNAGSGHLALSADDTSTWHTWRDVLWSLAPSGSATFDPPSSDGVPRWVWAIVLRRGAAVRVITGGGMDPPAGAPEPARSALAWMI